MLLSLTLQRLVHLILVLVIFYNWGDDSVFKQSSCSFQVYGGEARISTLRQLFPLMGDKKSLTSREERTQIKGKASLLAAVDYYVGMHSDIFISASPGNMHNAMVSCARCLSLNYSSMDFLSDGLKNLQCYDISSHLTSLE